MRREIPGILATLAWLAAVSTPRLPTPVDASGGDFSATRACADLAMLARHPRPARSAANEAARTALAAQLRAARLSSETHETTDGLTNIVALLPGTASTGTLALCAHHDTVPRSPGAADDGLGVAVVLEVARVLADGLQPRNDVLFLFTDGEELGTQGARAFLREHRWADEVAAVINLEAIGNAGPTVLFDAGPDSGHVVRAFSSRPPFADSLSESIYDIAPNNTDYRAFEERGIPGVNLAVVGGAQVYHAPDDVVDAVDPRTVQHYGDAVLAAARRLADVDLTVREGDRSYRDLFGLVLLSWPTPLGRWLGLAIGVMIAIAVIRHAGGPGRTARRAASTALRCACIAGLCGLAMWTPLMIRAAIAGRSPWGPIGDHDAARVALLGQLLVGVGVARWLRLDVVGVVGLLVTLTIAAATLSPNAVHPFVISAAALWLARRDVGTPPTAVQTSLVMLAVLAVAPIAWQVGLAAHVRAPLGAIAGAIGATALSATLSPLAIASRRVAATASIGGIGLLTLWAAIA